VIAAGGVDDLFTGAYEGHSSLASPMRCFRRSPSAAKSPRVFTASRKRGGWDESMADADSLTVPLPTLGPNRINDQARNRVSVSAIVHVTKLIGKPHEPIKAKLVSMPRVNVSKVRKHASRISGAEWLCCGSIASAAPLSGRSRPKSKLQPEVEAGGVRGGEDTSA